MQLCHSALGGANYYSETLTMSHHWPQHAKQRLHATNKSGVVTIQEFGLVVTGGRHRKIDQFTQLIVETTQSIEQIVDSLRFTRSKYRWRLSRENDKHASHEEHTNNAAALHW
jgi:hypothetical protein